jgi:hypothetical protein
MRLGGVGVGVGAVAPAGSGMSSMSLAGLHKKALNSNSYAKTQANASA